MIDYFLKFNDEASAIAAAEAAGKLGSRDAEGNWHWNPDHVAPNIKAWRISQNNPDGTHNYLTGWYCIVSTEKINATLNSDPALQFTLDRDGPPYVIKNNVGAVLTNLGYEPVFSGSHYPVGGVTAEAVQGKIVEARGSAFNERS